jgi:PAS domain-containing protein
MITDASDLIGLAIDKKNMEQSLEESEERYRSVVTNLTEGIMVIGAKGQILTSNPSALKILKIDHRNIGKNQRYFRRLFTEDGTTVDSGNDPASRVFRNGEPILDLTLGWNCRTTLSSGCKLTACRLSANPRHRIIRAGFLHRYYRDAGNAATAELHGVL